MDTNSANCWLVIIGGIGVLLSFINVVVLVCTLLVVKRYTDETQKIRESMSSQLTQITRQTDTSFEMHRTAQRQLEQMAQQTEELIHQTRLSILPAFSARFLWKEGGTHLRQLILANIGKGIAINIQIAPIDVAAPPNKEDITPEQIASITYRDIELWRVGGEKNSRIIFYIIQSVNPGDEIYVSYAIRPNEESDKKVSPNLSLYEYQRLDPISLVADGGSLEIDFQDIEGTKYHQVITREGDIFVPNPVKLAVKADRGVTYYVAPNA